MRLITRRCCGTRSFYAFSTTIGVLISCVMVAYGFSRFRFPFRDLLFMILISVMFLPQTVTVIPTFLFFTQIGWVGTWLPLIVPSFFTNPYDTFLLRQFFMTLPRELDESAMIDGANPFQILWSIIIPQSYPVIVAVTVFHIVWAWNDYFNPLIYLSTKMDLQPVSVALARFNGMYVQRQELIQAGSARDPDPAADPVHRRPAVLRPGHRHHRRGKVARHDGANPDRRGNFIDIPAQPDSLSG